MKGITHTQGFTLVELIAVILIMGILSATALPRFMDFGSDARKATLKSIAGTMKTTVETIKGKSKIEGFDKRTMSDYHHGGGTTLIFHRGHPEVNWERTWKYLLDIDAKLALTSILTVSIFWVIFLSVIISPFDFVRTRTNKREKVGSKMILRFLDTI